MGKYIKSFIINGARVDTIEKLRFSAGGNNFLITESAITGDNIADAYHIVKNTDKETSKKISHLKLLEILNQAQS